MKIKLLLIFLITLSNLSWAQNSDFKISVWSTSVLEGDFEIIERKEYEKISSEEFIEITPISQQALLSEYANTFKSTDSCIIYNAKNKVCKNRIQTKEYSDYNVKGIYFNHALIEVIGYEYWEYLSIDLENNKVFSSMGKPLTSKGETAISFSNYYGEEEIALTDLRSKKQFVIVIDGLWHTIESKVVKNTYYLKLQQGQDSKSEELAKFIKVKLKN